MDHRQGRASEHQDTISLAGAPSRVKLHLVDVHCHLDAKEFAPDLQEVLERAKAAGVVSILSNGTNPENNRRVLELSKEHPLIKPVLGFYPDDVVEQGMSAVQQELRFIEEHASQIAALGEVGLDLQHDADPDHFRMMKETLILFARLSRKIGKPLIVHSRKAEEETIELLETEQAKKVVFHCFGGKRKLASRIIKNGWYLSIPANINRSQQFQEFVRECPLSQLLTETDAPFLSPRGPGTRSEPGDVLETIKKIAAIKEMTPEETANQLYMNYQRLFAPF